MRIAFVEIRDAEDVRTFSGIPYHVIQSLRRQGVQVETISPLWRTYRYLYAVQETIARITGHSFEIDRQPFAQAILGWQVASRLKGGKFDAILSTSTTPVARLRVPVPQFCWLDSVIEGLVNYYGGYFERFSSRDLRCAHREMDSAMQRSTNVIVASEWVARDIDRFYGVSKEKVQLIPFGANIDIDHTLQDVQSFLEARLRSKCVLLFIGVDWERKGGPLAFEAARLLNERGIPTLLQVVGCNPPEAPFVERLGFIPKNSPEGLQAMKDLLRSATFFVMPTRAEAAGVVFCEAAAFGLPAIATKTGGVEDYVIDGETGYCLSLEAQGAAYADVIERTLASPEKYREMALAAFDRYRDVLNWDVGVAKLIALMEKAVTSAKSGDA